MTTKELTTETRADHHTKIRFNLGTDRTETNNLAAQNPKKVDELKQAWTQRFNEFRELALQDLPTGR